ncbi:MAG: hypothetical protein LBK72_09630, partial [Bifidobacteriaceae bacterium]|nr:hypothetical protein [Bifidobacteriaceae bacterium]
NLDLLAKTISMLHPIQGPPILAPAYDMVPWIVQPTDGRLAMSVNGVYRLDELTVVDLVAEGLAWGVRDANQIVAETLDGVLVATSDEAPHPRAHPDLRARIEANTRRILAAAPLPEH